VGGNTTIHRLLPSRSCDEKVGEVGNLSYGRAVHPHANEEDNLAKAPSLRKGKRCIGSPPRVWGKRKARLCADVQAEMANRLTNLPNFQA